MFRDLAVRLKRMIDAGDLKIALRSGRMVLVLPNDVLFDSGKTVVKPAGKETLAEVGRVLASFEGRRFQVAGHTDDEPIRFSGFASNWELSAERALRVVEFMVAERNEAGGAVRAPATGSSTPSGPTTARRIVPRTGASRSPSSRASTSS